MCSMWRIRRSLLLFTELLFNAKTSEEGEGEGDGEGENDRERKKIKFHPARRRVVSFVLSLLLLDELDLRKEIEKKKEKEIKREKEKKSMKNRQVGRFRIWTRGMKPFLPSYVYLPAFSATLATYNHNNKRKTG